MSPSTVSNLNKKIYAKIEAWRNRRIEGEHPYLYLDGIVMKRTWAGEVRNVSLLVASAVNSEGFREILGICEGAKEDKSGWSAFLRHLVDRGLNGVQLIISDACRGLMESAAEYLPDFRSKPCGTGANLRRAPRRAQSAFRALETSFGEMVARDRSPPAPRSCCLILHHTADATEKITGNMHTDLSSELVQKYCRGPRPRPFLQI